MTIKITAAICTYNRSDYLPDTIESLLKQNLPPEQYEIIVVDNNSTDDTAAIAAKFNEAPNFHYRFEPRPGLSHARNTAVQAAAGKIIAFIDDDAIASPHWLIALLEAYALFPQAWAVGGKVEPRWEAERPTWLGDDLLPLLSMLDLGNTVRTLPPSQELFGVNCSFRRRVFDELGLFRTNLGRQQNQLWGSEESELQARIQDRQQVIIYTPDALVWHRVPPERISYRYFMELAYYKGRTRARLMMTNPCGPTLLRHITQGGLATVKRWLLLSFQPHDQRHQLQCMRITASWLGFTYEITKAILRKKFHVRLSQ